MLVEELCMVTTRAKVTELMRTPTLIQDVRLRQEVEQCIELDGDFSPGADRVSRSIGAGYERELCLRLRALAVPFEDEETLRAKGLPKTPDVRLLVPLGLVGADGKVRKGLCVCVCERERLISLPYPHSLWISRRKL
jgi:hypothetical protein